MSYAVVWSGYILLILRPGKDQLFFLFYSFLTGKMELNGEKTNLSGFALLFFFWKYSLSFLYSQRVTDSFQLCFIQFYVPVECYSVQ